MDGREQTNLPWRKTPDNLYSDSAFKQISIDFPSLRWAAHNDFLPKNIVGRGREEYKFAEKKLGKRHLSQVITVNINDKPC